MGASLIAWEYLQLPSTTSGISVNKVNLTGNRIFLRASENGSDMGRQQVYYSATTGSPVHAGTTIGWREVEYPVDIMVRCQLLTQSVVEFSLRIYHPGEYVIAVRK